MKVKRTFKNYTLVLIMLKIERMIGKKTGKNEDGRRSNKKNSKKNKNKKYGKYNKKKIRIVEKKQKISSNYKKKD